MLQKNIVEAGLVFTIFIVSYSRLTCNKSFAIRRRTRELRGRWWRRRRRIRTSGWNGRRPIRRPWRWSARIAAGSAPPPPPSPAAPAHGYEPAAAGLDGPPGLRRWRLGRWRLEHELRGRASSAWNRRCVRPVSSSFSIDTVSRYRSLDLKLCFWYIILFDFSYSNGSFDSYVLMGQRESSLNFFSEELLPSFISEIIRFYQVLCHFKLTCLFYADFYFSNLAWLLASLD